MPSARAKNRANSVSPGLVSAPCNISHVGAATQPVKSTRREHSGGHPDSADRRAKQDLHDLPRQQQP